jgi:hypothetical protein
MVQGTQESNLDEIILVWCPVPSPRQSARCRHSIDHATAYRPGKRRPGPSLDMGPIQIQHQVHHKDRTVSGHWKASWKSHGVSEVSSCSHPNQDAAGYPHTPLGNLLLVAWYGWDTPQRTLSTATTKRQFPAVLYSSALIARPPAQLPSLSWCSGATRYEPQSSRG